MSTNRTANRGVQHQGDQYLLDSVNPVPRKKNLKYIIHNKVRYYQTDYEGYYISKSANVLSTRQNKINFLGIKPRKGEYSVVYLYQEGCRFKVPLHQLMMQTFYGDSPIGYVVDHKDCEKSNNSFDNLRYISERDNIRRSCCGKVPVQAKTVIAIIDGKKYTFPSEKEFIERSKFSSRAFKLLRVNKDPGSKRSKHLVRSFKLTKTHVYITIDKNPTYTRVDNLSDL